MTRIAAVALAVAATVLTGEPAPALAEQLTFAPMEAGAPACPPGQSDCDGWPARAPASRLAAPFLAARLYRDTSAGDDPTACALAVQTAAGWQRISIVNCNWMIIGSTPTPSVSVQQLVTRQLIPGGAPELMLRFRLEVYARGERESDDIQPGTRQRTDFLVVCALAADGTAGCAPPIATAGATTDYSGRGHQATRSWRRTWRFDRHGRLALGAITGHPSAPLDPDGMYGATVSP